MFIKDPVVDIYKYQHFLSWAREAKKMVTLQGFMIEHTFLKASPRVRVAMKIQHHDNKSRSLGKRWECWILRKVRLK